MDALDHETLVLLFGGLMGVAIMAYVLLDGYDLGVGVLLSRAGGRERDEMVNAIAPFWDANETWLVLGAGILLVAFPLAHGIILRELYLPVLVMLVGLILRGTAFELRVKSPPEHLEAWNTLFVVGSATAALAQGFMLGHFVAAFRDDLPAILFACLVAPCLVAGYMLLGAGWLLIKTEGELQRRAAAWGRKALWLTAGGIALVSIATPLVSPRIFDRWFSLQMSSLMLVVPLLVAAGVLWLSRWLNEFDPVRDDSRAWVPLAVTVGLFLVSGAGLAYSAFPYLVIDRVTLWDAAATDETLRMILLGVAIVLPPIVLYSAFSYRIFRGKTTHLEES
ncbi:MAG: cytochrome d ubiquinol oxidase subunit II [Betaproteobacteria bacterium]|nr:cytochrome d ubiquinol oxidase subunit II [Betaproteobacteria bacterium]